MSAVTVGTTKVKSSFAFDGLLESRTTGGRTFLEGVVRGDANAFGVPILSGVPESWDSRGLATTYGRTALGTVRFGDEEIDLGVTAALGFGLLGGLDCSAEASWLLTEYGPAVAGRGAISGLLLPGLTGAPEMPPAELRRDDSGLVRTVEVVVAAVGGCDEPETVTAGEKCAIAEPGRAGGGLVAMALFWAIMASRILGFGGPMVLLDKPSPGRATPSGFLGELGLLGSFSSSFAAVASSPLMMASAFAGQMPAKVQ